MKIAWRLRCVEVCTSQCFCAFRCSMFAILSSKSNHFLTVNSQFAGTSHTIYHGHSDFYYVPKALVPNFHKYMGAFAEHQIFLEISVPMWAKCFAPSFDLRSELLELCTTWDYGVRYDVYKWGPKCISNTTIIHPTKYSSPDGLRFAQEWMSKHASKYSQWM